MFFGLFPLFFPYQGIIERRPQIPDGVLFLIIACEAAIQQPRLLFIAHRGRFGVCPQAQERPLPVPDRVRITKIIRTQAPLSVPHRYKTVR
ncbi:MAG: hypothetical protein IKT99_06995, partial [Oscillospiraceae bacterium]|nr:hypothetical protein [Oscillospiraceae bacterium]